MDFVAEAKRALQLPDSYFPGENEDNETWGRIGVGYTRDSGPRELAVAEAIWTELDGKFHDDIEWIHSSHWAVGWSQEIMIRVLKKPGEVNESNITEAFKYACEMSGRDICYYEDEIMAAENEKRKENLRADATSSGFIAIPGASYSQEEWDAIDALMGMLQEMGAEEVGDDGLWYLDDDIEVAAFRLGFIDMDCWDEWMEWLETHPAEAEDFVAWCNAYNHRDQGRLFDSVW